MQDKVLGKKMAKYGAVGALIGIPMPFVGPLIGAAAGAGYAYYKYARTSSGTGDSIFRH